MKFKALIGRFVDRFKKPRRDGEKLSDSPSKLSRRFSMWRARSARRLSALLPSALRKGSKKNRRAVPSSTLTTKKKRRMRSSLLSLFKNKRRRNRPVKQTSTPVLPSSDGGNDEFMVEPAILEAAGPSSAVLPMSIAIESDYQVSYQLNAASSSSSNNNSGNSSISSNNSISSNSSDSSSTTTSSISSNSKGTSTSTNTNSSGSSIDESSECNTYATALSETEVIIESPETSVDWYETAEKETKYKNLREVLSHLLCVRKEEPPPSDAITLIVIAIIIAITIADTLAAVLFYREQF